MAEIKSTMEMVLERAAKMADKVSASSVEEEIKKKGMKIAANYLAEQINDINTIIAQASPKEHQTITAGVSETLLRNIVLPRDEMTISRSVKSLQGLASLGVSTTEFKNTCQEIKQILDQYNQHKTQTKEKLEAAFKQQVEQQGSQPNQDLNQQFQQEWAKTLADLNDQYQQALEQRKQVLISNLSL